MKMVVLNCFMHIGGFSIRL